MTQQEAKKEIEHLVEKINYHNDLYYRESRTEISDLEFDKLLEKLIALENQFPQFRDSNSPSQRVGGTITKEFATVHHKYPMLSLGNTYSQKELEDFDARVAKGLEGDPYEYFCELTFDGVSISLTYENGVFTRGVTRGDGVRGNGLSNIPDTDGKQYTFERNGFRTFNSSQQVVNRFVFITFKTENTFTCQIV